MRKYSKDGHMPIVTVIVVAVIFIGMAIWVALKGENTFVGEDGKLTGSSVSQTTGSSSANESSAEGTASESTASEGTASESSSKGSTGDNNTSASSSSSTSKNSNTTEGATKPVWTDETASEGTASESSSKGSTGDNNTSASSSSSTSKNSNTTEGATKPVWTDEQRKAPFFEEAMPILVNSENKIPEDFKPTLLEVDKGYSLDEKAYNAYIAMRKAAYADGINIWLVSAYRSTERQQQNFDNKIREHMAMGKTEEEAYIATAAYIAVPGTSEHSLGLAADINSLEESFENTKTFNWLVKNCAKYGFILRYPKDKVDITKIAYEPWHYRYVGSNHAQIIMDKGICLEEYLSGQY